MAHAPDVDAMVAGEPEDAVVAIVGLESIDQAAASREGLEVVARPSGGGPVLWDADLIAIDVVLPAGHPRPVLLPPA